RAGLRFPARPPQAAAPAFARKRAPTGPLPRPCGSDLGRECLLAQVCSFRPCGSDLGGECFRAQVASLALVGATLVANAFGAGVLLSSLWERSCRECFRARARSHRAAPSPLWERPWSRRPSGAGVLLRPCGATLGVSAFG